MALEDLNALTATQSDDSPTPLFNETSGGNYEKLIDCVWILIFQYDWISEG